jgi:hypothetical protein
MQEKCSESFYMRFNDSVRMLSRSPSRTHREGRQTQHTADERAASLMRGQRYDSTRSANDRLALNNRSSQTKTAIRCHNCTGFGLLPVTALRDREEKHALLTRGK